MPPPPELLVLVQAAVLFELASNVTSLRYSSGDGKLSYSEFIELMKDRLKRGFMVSVLVLEHNFNILRSTFTWLVALYDARFLRARDDMRLFRERFTGSLALIISAKRLADFSRARLARGLKLSRI